MPVIMQSQADLAQFDGLLRARWFELDRDLNKRQRGPAQGLVFAKDQGQIAPDGSVRNGHGGQYTGFYVGDDIRPRDEPHADVSSHKALQEFAGIEFHGDFWFKAAFVEEVLDCVARPADLGQQQREANHIGDACVLAAAERMSRRDHNDQFIAMNHHYGQPLVIHRSGNHAKIDGVVDDRFQDLGPLQPADLHANAGVEFLEIGKYLWKDMQTCTLIGPNYNFTARNALHFRYGYQHGFARIQCLFGVFLEELAGAGQRHFAATAVKQLGPDLLFQGANLGRDGRLCAKAFLRRPGKAGVPGDFKKRFQLIEVHASRIPPYPRLKKDSTLFPKLGRGVPSMRWAAQSPPRIEPAINKRVKGDSRRAKKTKKGISLSKRGTTRNRRIGRKRPKILPKRLRERSSLGLVVVRIHAPDSPTVAP